MNGYRVLAWAFVLAAVGCSGAAGHAPTEPFDDDAAERTVGNVASGLKSEHGAKLGAGGPEKKFVALVTFSDGRRTAYLCTGLFLNSNLVITAGHCVVNAFQLGRRRAYVNLPNVSKVRTKRDATSSEAWDLVRYAAVHKGYPGVDNQRDIAVLRLQTGRMEVPCAGSQCEIAPIALSLPRRIFQDPGEGYQYGRKLDGEDQWAITAAPAKFHPVSVNTPVDGNVFIFKQLTNVTDDGDSGGPIHFGGQFHGVHIGLTPVEPPEAIAASFAQNRDFVRHLVSSADTYQSFRAAATRGGHDFRHFYEFDVAPASLPAVY